MVIFLCRDSLEGILCGVYDAWMSRLGHMNVKLEIDGEYNMELFAEYREAVVTEEKTMKVIRAVRSRISEYAYSWIYRASLSFEPGKADAVYRFLVYGFNLGGNVTECLQIPAVHELFRLNRAVAGEAHLLTEFLRFSELPSRVLFAEIGPKNQVTSLLMPHFSDRLRMEQFVVYDKNHRQAGIHTPGTDWYLISGEEAARLGRLAGKTDSSEYAVLWRAFYNSIGIKERENYACQRTHLPLRFRPFMTEFQKT